MYRRCEAMTKKGERCRGGAMKGMDYCGPHMQKHGAARSPVEIRKIDLTNEASWRTLPL